MNFSIANLEQDRFFSIFSDGFRFLHFTLHLKNRILGLLQETTSGHLSGDQPVGPTVAGTFWSLAGTLCKTFETSLKINL